MNSQTMLLSDLLAVFKKSKLLILLTVMIVGGAAYYVSQYVIEPTYEASTQVLIVPKQEAGSNVVDSTQVSSSLSLINTYRVIMRSPAILNEVQEQVANAPDDISEVLLVESEEESQVINIVVEYSDPIVAANIANVITEVFANEIPDLMNIDNVRILSVADVPSDPVAPSTVMYTGIGLIVGFVIGSVLALIRYTFDKRIRDEKEAEKLLALPVIGNIPVIEKRDMAAKRSKPEPVKEDVNPVAKGDETNVPPTKDTRQSS
ncbi:Wzz/FepE/Etk N-terminal domain-containing protein [Exiguobacterium sp.]|uniref:YveK family protein n=1 Tax=Exiguobacterium sp. TaxID=44751 RepID=UPI00307DD06C